MQVGVKVNASIRRTERFEIYPAFKGASGSPKGVFGCAKGLWPGGEPLETSVFTGP